MRGIGTVVNVLTVLFGTALGLTVGSRLPERLRSTVLSGVGLLTLVIGMQEAFETHNVVFPLVALIAGGAVGELLGIEERLERLGERLRRRFERGPALEPALEHVDEALASGFVEGFVAASLLFCVGPLTILGSIQDGLGGPDHAQLLFVKSALDGLVSIVFAATLGWGVGFSALTIVAVQGSLTLAASAADAVLTVRMIDEMTATGGVMILGIGLRLLELRRVRVASFLPALVLAPVLVGLFAR
ncbi:MAG: DUF554 domain-containing protein [Actinomycetota bacterium]|nr:DUF554 domain-containing protein [Actinomycetota bacterium]